MKKLLNTYGLNIEMEYYEMIEDSFVNGQRKQAIEQINAMPKGNRKELCIMAIENSCDFQTSILIENISTLIDCI